MASALWLVNKMFHLTLVDISFFSTAECAFRKRVFEGASISFFLFLFLRFHLFIYFFRAGKGRRKVEKHQCVVASCMSPTGELAHNPGMCPDWELNLWPFGLQPSTQSTELHQPGQGQHFSSLKNKLALLKNQQFSSRLASSLHGKDKEYVFCQHLGCVSTKGLIPWLGAMCFMIMRSKIVSPHDCPLWHNW